MNIALILSGGSGSRMGTDIPKQYIEAGGKPVISYCLETLADHELIDGLHIVADEKWRSFILESSDVAAGLAIDTANAAFQKKLRGFSVPGESRQLSILNGLRDIRRYAEGKDFVLIHDAARPMLSGKQVSDVLKAAEDRDGVLPVLPMKDTVYFSKDGRHISGLLEREKIFSGQAPEVFRLEPYYKANIALMPDRILEIKGSTEPAVMAGLDITMIAGDEANFKITTQDDMERFKGAIV